MILFPNAKINLGLNITARRPDGYHNIESLFLPVDWHDVIEIVPSPDNETHLTVYGRKPDCQPEENLVIKAYRALSSKVALPPVAIYLEKIIPEGAGLGGGSSDAAFTLKGLTDLFGLGLNDDALCDIAAGLGADCSFFIHNRPMIATGTGTVLTPVDFDFDSYFILIVKPDVSVSTKEAYAGVNPKPWAISLSTLLSTNRLTELHNDFEDSIFPKYPVLNDLKDKLYRNGAFYASMSGSGSAVYGLFTNKRDAMAASEHFKSYPYIHVGRLTR